MLKILPILIHVIFVCANLSFGQEPKQSQLEQKIICPILPKATFPGGEDSMKVFLGKNLRWPTDDCVDGTVVVGFCVNEKGELHDFTIKRSLGKAFDEEAIRVLKLMPKFQPAMKDGKPISVEMNIPIKFRLE